MTHLRIKTDKNLAQHKHNKKRNNENKKKAYSGMEKNKMVYSINLLKPNGHVMLQPV